MFSSDSASARAVRVAAATLTLWSAAGGAPGQIAGSPEAQALLLRIDQARGTPAKPVSALRLTGTFDFVFEGMPDRMGGKFENLHLGTDRSRTRLDLGEHGVAESGIAPDVVWEIDPVTGARVYDGQAAAAIRRQAAILRGASPKTLYKEAVRLPDARVDGRDCGVLKLTAAGGRSDTWYVDLATGFVTRVDIRLPMSEGADLVWDLGSEVDAQITFRDWKPVAGVHFAHVCVTKMGKVTLESVCTKVEADPKLEAAAFEPPESVRNAKPKESAAGAESRPRYEVVDRAEQHVASIRLTCKTELIGPTMGEMLPEVMLHLNAVGARMTGPPFSRYHAFGDGTVDLEAGFPIAKPVAEKGRVKSTSLPAGRTLVGWHVGPYDKLAEAHQQLQAHAEKSGLKARGAPWEVYWTDPGVVPDPAKWRTQLFLPVE